MEWCNFKNALLSTSFMDQGRPTTFRQSRLWSNNLHEAVIHSCDLENFDRFDMTNLQTHVARGTIRIIGV